MPDKKSFAEIVLPLAAPGTFTYEIPEEMSAQSLIGKRVVVHFGSGRRLYTGLVISLSSVKEGIQTKAILEVLDSKPCISEKSVKLWQWMADYYMCTLGEIMNAAFPAGMNISSESRFVLNRDISVPVDELKDKELSIVNALEQSGELSLNDLSKLTGIKQPIHWLTGLVERRLVFMHEELKGRFQQKKVAWLALSDEVMHGNSIDQVIAGLQKAPKQLKLLMSLIEKTHWDGGEKSDSMVRKSELMASCHGSDASLKALVDKGIVHIHQLVESRISNSVESNQALLALNDFQSVCMRQIKEMFIEKDVVLLQGVTSSGKTEIYSHLIAENLEKGKQVLYLLPEISLTSQLIDRLKKYFGNKIAVYHSRLTQNEKVEVWKQVAGNKKSDIRIILGARSSVFLPFSDLGLIVVDEEHDRSFKQQDPAPRYEARDCAVVLAKYHKAKVLLGSATPSLESVDNARTGKYGFAQLTKRYGGFEMPEIFAVDLTEARRKRKMQGSFSEVLKNEIAENLKAGEQVILFQNRRGYSPFIVCDQCAHTPKCRNCDVSLTRHKKSNILKCHYCGFQISMIHKCPECKVGNFTDVGFGTERIEEELASIFPHAKLARFDLDSTRKKNAFQNLLNAFEEKHIDILIGTQMVTKGLDFENVGLVGIINADNMLKFPDFRSFERTYQILTQVSGRAGRKKKRGKVIIQTYDPFHPVIQYTLSNNFKAFVKAEMQERKLFKYPPFYRILDVRLKHRDRQVLYEASRDYGLTLKRLFGERLLGPEFPYIERIRNLYSMHFILKVSKADSISAVKKKLAVSIDNFTSKDTFKSIKVQVDVDPY